MPHFQSLAIPASSADAELLTFDEAVKLAAVRRSAAAAKYASSLPPLCACLHDQPCDTFRGCRQTDEELAIEQEVCEEYFDGGAAALARELISETCSYYNLQARTDQYAASVSRAASLAQLRAACVEDAYTQTTPTQQLLFQRVHSDLDWDERHELIALLDSLDRVDEDADCFRYRLQKKMTYNVQRFLYKLCCLDEAFDRRRRSYQLRCLCGDQRCINPQHYVHEPREQCTARKRKRVEQPTAEALDQAYAEMTPDEIKALAIAACIADRDELDERRREYEANMLEMRQEKETYRDFEADEAFSDDCTPYMSQCNSQCETPIDDSGGTRQRPRLSFSIPVLQVSVRSPDTPVNALKLISDRCSISALICQRPSPRWNKPPPVV